MSAQPAQNSEQAFKAYFSALCSGKNATYDSAEPGIHWEAFYAGTVERFQDLISRVEGVEKFVTDSSLEAVLRLAQCAEAPSVAEDNVESFTVESFTSPNGAPDDHSREPATSMTEEVSRAELDAKFERTEARVDLRLSEFNSSMKDLMSKIQIDIAGVRADIASSQRYMTQDISTMKTALAEEKIALTASLQSVKDELMPLKLAANQTAEVSASLQNFRSSNWKTIWGAAGTVILALAATLVALYALGFSAFESGRNTAIVVRDAQQKIDEAAASMAKHRDDAERLLEQAKRLHESATPLPAASPSSPPPAK